MFWLFAQMFVLCAFAFLAGAVLTWLPLRTTIRDLRAERSPVVRPALTAKAVIIPEQPYGRPVANGELESGGELHVNSEWRLTGESRAGAEARPDETPTARIVPDSVPADTGPTTDKPADQPSDQHTGKPTDQLVGQPVDQSVVDGPANGARSDQVKGSSKSMIFHTPDSPYFKRMKGDVTFGSVEEAERAGYTQWRPRSAATAAR
ncbi:hypothetical protein [Actinosynnema sp. NPDC023587]|uniref:sunset domain-containing protein n=1 Tax=Actinosynnema sp. NPDC023587 TaxID=3154695 RepID=UPI0033E5109E